MATVRLKAPGETQNQMMSIPGVKSSKGSSVGSSTGISENPTEQTSCTIAVHGRDTMTDLAKEGGTRENYTVRD